MRLIVQWIATVLWETARVRTLRKTLSQVANQGELDASGALLVDGERQSCCLVMA